MPFEITSAFLPTGDQPRAIEELISGLGRGERHQVLLGVTGSGKTFTVANVVAEVRRPTLVIAHNKTLAAQLYGEFKELFPSAAVHYFVSYYDYYQPEAYVPSSDTYIEKDSSINDEIDRMRHAATHALLTRNDVLIVASVSCIYGLGTAEAYYGLLQQVERGQEFMRDLFIRSLIDIQYERNYTDFHRGTFRVRGATIEVFPPYEEDRAIRIEFFGDVVESIHEFDPLRGLTLAELDKAAIFPNSHYVSAPETRKRAIDGIRDELRERLGELGRANKLVEAQRLEQRTMFDLEMLEQMGFCSGIENYSRWLSGRKAGDPPPCLLDYFPKGFLLVIDESHQTVPQIGAMYRGDRSRKETLVEYGFRLPSALDNRPLAFHEFERDVNGRVILYADSVTDSMRRALDETGRRRERQKAYNAEHGITPQTVRRNISDLGMAVVEADWVTVPLAAEGAEYRPEQLPEIVAALEQEMKEAAEALDFEKAAQLRDRILALKDLQLGLPPKAAGMKGLLGSGAVASAAALGRMGGARRPQQRRRRR